MDVLVNSYNLMFFNLDSCSESQISVANKPFSFRPKTANFHGQSANFRGANPSLKCKYKFEYTCFCIITH